MELKIGEKSTILGLSIFERALVFFFFSLKARIVKNLRFCQETTKALIDQRSGTFELSIDYDQRH